MDTEDVKTAKADSVGKKDTLDSAFAMIRKIKEDVERMKEMLKNQFGAKIDGSANIKELVFLFVLAAAIPLCVYAATTIWDIGSGDNGTCVVTSSGGKCTLTVDTIVAGGVTNLASQMVGNVPVANMTNALATGTYTIGANATPTRGCISNLFTRVSINGTNYYMLTYP